MSNQKLMIIDDSPDIHELVVIWLAGEPVEFVSCKTGEEGLASAAKIRPDLILLDVDLPGFDGFEVCRRLKSASATADIPVVFLTGASSTEEKLRGLDLGASDYITKPFDPAELRARVRSSLNTKRLMDLLAQKAQTLKESEERFRVLAENSSDVISRHLPDGTYIYISPAATSILGYTPEKMIGRKLCEFVHPEDVNSVAACYAAPRTPGATGTVAFRFLRNDKQVIWLESTCRTLTDATGAVREIHASARDIGGRKQMEYREQIRAEVLEMIAQGRPLNDILRRLTEAAERQEPQAIAAGVMLNDGILHHCAPNLPGVVASSIERQLYSFVSRFSALAAQNKERVIVCDLLSDPAWQELRPSLLEHALRSCWAILIRARHRDASGVFVLYRRDNQCPTPPAVEMLKLASQLIEVAVEHNKLNEQLTLQAQHDTLTGLPNRALFSDRMEQALAAAARNGRPGAVVLIDVDRFKHINDTYGHQAGDEMLCQVAHRLRGRLRATDTLARMGGDEFAVILGDLADPGDAERVCKTLVAEFKLPIELQGRKQFVTISVGSAVYPRDARDPMTLLKYADLALYRAKDAGRDTAKAFTSDMGEGSMERMEIECELRQAVGNGELRLYYQPKVNPTGGIVGVEALVRWQHPRLGMVPPAKFIPLAEDTGIIVSIGRWVLEESARQVHAWFLAGLGVVSIAVNVSAIQFAQPDFVGIVSNALAAAGMQEPWLEIELTESLLMVNIRDAVGKLAQLHDKKVSIAIDDFGTGYSSLAYLQRMSLDTLKIDHSFVRTIVSANAARSPMGSNGASGHTIIGAIVALAKSLGLQVVAEGVETEIQREHLIRIGCDCMQGYLFSPAKPAEQIEPILRKSLEAVPWSLARSAEIGKSLVALPQAAVA